MGMGKVGGVGEREVGEVVGVGTRGRWGGLGVRLGWGGKGRILYFNNNKIREKNVIIGSRGFRKIMGGDSIINY